MTEKQVQTKLLKFLSGLDYCYSFKVITANKSGVPDVVACICGHFIAFECKNSKGKLTKLQEVNLNKIKKSKGTPIIVRPKNLNDVKNFILGFIKVHSLSSLAKLEKYINSTNKNF